MKWLLILEIKNDKSEEAESLIAEVEPGSKFERELSLDLAVALFEFKKDKFSAEDILDRINKKFNDKNTLETVTFIRDHFENFVQAGSNDNNTKDISENVVNENKDVTLSYEITGNYPNPFNPATTFKYCLPKISDVTLKIYDILGKEIKSFLISTQPAGYQNIYWDGRNEINEPVSSGIYIYTFIARSLEDNETFCKSLKLLLLK